MQNPIVLLSDDEPNTPLPSLSKKPRTGPDPTLPTVFLIDDDPTPIKPGHATSSIPSTPSFVAETPMSDFSIVKCTAAAAANPNPRFRVSDAHRNLSGNGEFICLESENDEPDICFRMENLRKNDTTGAAVDGEEEMGWSSRYFGSKDSLEDANLNRMPEDGSSAIFPEDDVNQGHEYSDKENFGMQQICDGTKNKRTKVHSDKNNSTHEVVRKKKMTKEERTRLMEEKKLKKQQEKVEKEALKAQAAELKKMEKEKQKWEKGKLALKSIVAEFDTKVVEQGSIGGHLLTRFADKGLTYRITSNPIERSIVWTMSVPENISQLSLEGTEIRYLLLVYEAEEFCNLVINESLLDHVSRARSRYPSYTICYLTNRLMAYINKREKEQYKNIANDNGWGRSPIEEALAKLTTHFSRVHHRQCTDEAEVAEHVVGLTCSLASCQFRKKLTSLSVNANGSFIPNDFVDKNLIKRSSWLKALVAIPKVQPRFAVAIWKKYPTMKSLLSAYMDPSKSVHEKEFLLEDLTTEGLLGGDRRVGQVCSKRVYRILMAQSGSIKTDDVEDGADFFRHQSS